MMFDCSTTIEVDPPMFDDPVGVLISEEGARYIAEVMEREYKRTGDEGAKDIFEAIRGVFCECC